MNVDSPIRRHRLHANVTIAILIGIRANMLVMMMIVLHCHFYCKSRCATACRFTRCKYSCDGKLREKHNQH